MMQLLIRENNRGWETISTDPPLYDAVTPEDIMRVANAYFTPERRAVAIYYRKESDQPADPLLAGLDDEERQRVTQAEGMLGQLDVTQLTEFLAQAEQTVDQVPAENRDMAEAIVELIRRRLAELGGGQ